MRMGCSANVNGLMPCRQKMWYCIECSKSAQPFHAICLCCKEICHAGHKTQPVSDGQKILGVCDCGVREDIFENRNPLHEIFVQKQNSWLPANENPKSHCFCRFDLG